MVELESSNKSMCRIPSKRKGHSFTRKCSSLVKEQRARIYVLRRCATMLLCWYIHGDD
ncbi:small polypeptide DEVIL 19-like [Alnus glutinosa]|uniref:small polypeptide DEVIL 19-like n=1 Tax=Alnus glutinosa TaxID=3517 RepID=UPI002D7722B1|nr:small polypeptide DEVIL 19-like [Alnus glutinosa]